MYELKPISLEAIPEALQKAERYRLLNEPSQAESICLDILAARPDHQPALVILLLSLTDQFEHGVSVADARDVVPKLSSEYERCYYTGIICEREARAQLKKGAPGSGYNAYEAMRYAMEWYERAQEVRPAGNEDAILRWNTCARTLERYSADLRPRPEEAFAPILDD